MAHGNTSNGDKKMANQKEITHHLKQNYYNLADGLQGLKSLSEFEGDKEAAKILKALEELDNRLYRHLENNYKGWD